MICNIDATSDITVYETANNCKVTKVGLLHFMDQQKEKEIGLGTAWKVAKLEEGEVMIHSNLYS